MLVLAFSTLLLSLASLVCMRRVAFRYGLVDKPSARKQHSGDIPFIGGIAIFVTIYFLGLAEPAFLPYQDAYFISSAILIGVGTLDDKYDIPAKYRLVMLLGLSFWLVNYQSVELKNLGDLLGLGSVIIEDHSLLLTTLAIIGCVTAFNMIDGADGLLGGVSSVSFAALGLLFYLAGETLLALFCLLFVIAMVPYLVCNLELLRKQHHKVFMGDAGTFFVGFTIIWLLTYGSQNLNEHNNQPIINAATALWIIALPLMDMAMVMIRRIRKKQSPFSADRLHLHHIFQRMGMSKKAMLAVLVLFSAATTAIGVLGQLLDVAEHIMFYLFLLMFACYVVSMNHIWKISVWFRRNKPLTGKKNHLQKL